MKSPFSLTSIALGTLALLTAGAPLPAQELCGSQNQSVCLEGDARVSFVDNTPLSSGSRIVLLLPGINVNNRYDVSGSAEVPFRFDAHGAVTDTQGGSWSDLEILARDNTGLTAVAFTLNQSNANDGTLEINLSGIRVCQQIADGPGDVNLTLLFFQNTNPGKALQVRRGKQSLTAFRDCSTYAGDLPLFEENDRLFLINPHQERVWVTLDGNRFSMGAHEQRAVDARSSGQALSFSCNLPLVTALASDDGDLAATTLQTTNAKDWLVPHLARNDAHWENQWIFSSQAQVSLSWAQGERTRYLVPAFAQNSLSKGNAHCF
ncbi:hypothetical protein [Acanthopleuribacter pedis]|uniref:Uncharacterized protein n=1 Tax=Acanthopleuribacter pedis TaxID=442870 RepID=A0A8J7U127_9BACT|nr:hypothetical protein [Acanthopleuribacter pedis]MBO1317718.1 hypothetical protein [Acanthopleuribacter pedis]